MDLTPLLPAVTALFGAWAGARIALSRFKSERAFDRRLDWHERMFRALMEADLAIESAIAVERKRGETAAAGLWQQVYDKFEEASALIAQRELYTTQAGYDALTEALGDIYVVEQHGQIVAEFDSYSVRRYRGERAREVIQRAASVLADAARADLGWQRLDRGSPARQQGLAVPGA